MKEQAIFVLTSQLPHVLLIYHTFLLLSRPLPERYRSFTILPGETTSFSFIFPYTHLTVLFSPFFISIHLTLAKELPQSTACSSRHGNISDNAGP